MHEFDWIARIKIYLISWMYCVHRIDASPVLFVWQKHSEWRDFLRADACSFKIQLLIPEGCAGVQMAEQSYSEALFTSLVYVLCISEKVTVLCGGEYSIPDKLSHFRERKLWMMYNYAEGGAVRGVNFVCVLNTLDGREKSSSNGEWKMFEKLITLIAFDNFSFFILFFQATYKISNRSSSLH